MNLTKTDSNQPANTSTSVNDNDNSDIDVDSHCGDSQLSQRQR